jgi:hypothetical protein
MVKLNKVLAFFFKNTYYSVFFIFFVGILLNIAYILLTPFQKKIRIKDKSGYASGKNVFNIVSDDKDNVYSVHNSLFALYFTASEVLYKLTVGKTYILLEYPFIVAIIRYDLCLTIIDR